MTRPAEIELFQPPLPKPVGLEQVKWHVITPANFEEKIKEIEKLQGGEFVVYAITPKTYENMSYNMQELRRYIREQQEIIIYYRSATTKDVNKDGKVDALDWIELNERLQGDKITVDVQ